MLENLKGKWTEAGLAISTRQQLYLLINRIYSRMRSLKKYTGYNPYAIAIIGRFVRLFALWAEPIEEDDKKSIEYDRVQVPEISMWDMFDDAFTAIARDGANTVEVAVQLQKAFESLASIGVKSLREVAIHHARLARARAENALEASEDLEVLRKAAKFADPV